MDDPGADTGEQEKDDNRANIDGSPGKLIGQVGNPGILTVTFDNTKQKDIQFQVTMQPGDNYRVAAAGGESVFACHLFENVEMGR